MAYFIILLSVSSLLDFISELINEISNYTTQIQVCNAMIQFKQYKFKLCDSNSGSGGLYFSHLPICCFIGSLYFHVL